MARAAVIVIAALLVGQTAVSIYVGRTAGATALQYSSSVFPNAQWTVVRQTLEPWSSDIQRGNLRATGGIGPAWVVELSAPADSTWKGYDSVVVINALTGTMRAGGVGGSN